MAYETGVATDHEDLWSKLLTFLTTDAELVALNQNWEIVWNNDDSNSDSSFIGTGAGPQVMLRGPGLSQQDEIYVALAREENVDQDVATVFMRGATGYVPSADDYNEHINSQPKPVRWFMRTQSMNYWFFASGRRFMGVVQVGSIYQSFYAGFFLPYGDPTVYGYPMFVGGCEGVGLPNNADDWRDVENGHSAFPLSNYSSSTSSGYEPSAWMLSPQGDWLRCAVNTSNVDVNMGPAHFGFGGGLGADLAYGQSTNGYGYEAIRTRMGRLYGDDFGLTPITLVQANAGDQMFGVLDGVSHVPGRGQSVENKISANNFVHLVVQDVFRTAEGSYFAMVMYPEDSNSGVEESSNS